PSSENLDMLKKMIEAGLNVARLNFSHGDYEEHRQRIQNIRRACSELNRHDVAILLDTKGPEIRIGNLREEPIELVQGDQLVLTTEEILGDSQRISVTYEGLPQDVQAGSTILIDDGLIELAVMEVKGSEIRCQI